MPTILLTESEEWEDAFGGASGSKTMARNNIEELSSEFSALLSLSRYTPRQHRYYSPVKVLAVVRSNDPYQGYSPPPDPWTEPFSILSLPREIRDTIYEYVLYSPGGILYSNKPRLRSPCLSLFLISRQIYAEALAAFFRCNQVRIFYKPERAVDYKRSISNSLRLFPEMSRKLVQKIKMLYGGYGAYLGYGASTSSVWARICGEARMFKRDWFPLLREFTAKWTMTDVEWDRELQISLGDGSLPYEEKIGAFMNWMRTQHFEHGTSPPKSLVVAFSTYFHGDDYENLNTLFMAALERFRGEVNVAWVNMGMGQTAEDELQEELNQSRERWLEEEWGDYGKGAKKRRKGNGHGKRSAGSE